MFLSRLGLCCLAFMSFLTSCGSHDGDAPSGTFEEWDRNNDPKLLAAQYAVNFAALPLQGQSRRIPWTDSYWPSNKGGLAQRWQSDAGDGFSYQVNDFKTILKLDPNALARLSPAEKYDIYRGDMTYSLVRFERAYNFPHDPHWSGLCHGWAAAAINLNEPKPVTMTSPQGLPIAFGSADVKALLAFAQQDNAVEEDSKILGKRCDVKAGHPRWGASLPECRDTNAGSFHIVLTNFLGLRKESFVIDSKATEEVWNRPVYAYESKIVKKDDVYRNAARGTFTVLQLRTDITYMSNSQPHWRDGVFTASAAQTVTYEYTVELDRSGNVIGGEWLQEERPDFMWTQRPPRWSALTSGIEEIYRKSIQR